MKSERRVQSQDLIDAFKTARYKVLEPELELKIGEVSESLNKLLERYGCKSWAFITPFNPGSQVISNEENESRFDSLRGEVKGHVSFEGQGGGQQDQWPLEKSLLILGISLLRAKRLGRKYGQDAIVFGYKNKRTELIILNDTL